MTSSVKLLRLRLLLSFFALVSVISAQETNFTQFYNLRTATNPAFVSVPTGVELTMGYRRHWSSLQEGLSGAFAGAAIRQCGTSLAYGVTVSQLGENVFGYRIREASFQLGVFVNTSRHSSLHFGMEASAGQRSLDANKQVFSGQLDPVFGIVQDNSPFVSIEQSSLRTFALSSGAVWRGEIEIGSLKAPVSAGFAAHNLGGSRDISFQSIETTLQPRWIAHASLAIPIAEEFSNGAAMYLTPMFRFDMQGKLRQTFSGCIIQFKSAYLGVVFQHARNPANLGNTNTLSLAPGLEVPFSDGNHMTLGYSFDLPLSGLGPSATGGSHEITMRFSFDNTCMFGSGNGRGRQGRGFFGGGKRRGKTRCYQFEGKNFLGFLN